MSKEMMFGEPGGRADLPGADDSSGRAGQDGADRILPGAPGRDEPAVRLHDPRPGSDSASFPDGPGSSP